MANRTVSVILQAEIAGYVSGMTKASLATKGFGDSASTSTGAASKGFDIAGKGAMLMGVAVAGALAGVISKSMDFEKSMSAVGAATQATGSNLLALRDAAMKAGAATQYSATEAADAITEMGKAGVSAKDIMGGGLTGALSLAAAGQIDVAEAAGIASTAMTQFSLAGKDLPHVADLLAAGAGKAMGSVDDLGMALNQAGLVAAASGLSIEETTGTLAAFASAGLIGSDAGTSMKTMLQKLQAPSKEAAETMSELGITMYDANGNMLSMSGMAGQLKDHMSGLTQEQRNAALATIFGSDAVRAANVLYSQGEQGIADWTNKVNDAGYAQKQAAALTDNLSGDLERLGGSFDTLLITIGGGVQGPLRALVQMLGGIVDGVSGLIDAFSSLPAPVQTVIVSLGAMAALNGPLGGVLGVLRGFGGGLGASIGGTFSVFGEALGYARANGEGLGTVLRSVGSYAGGELKSSLSGLVALLGGPWGLAIAAIAGSFALLTSATKDNEHVTRDTTAAQQSFADALRATNGLIDESTRRSAAKALQDEGLLGLAGRLKISTSLMTDSILGNKGAYQDILPVLEAYRVQLLLQSASDRDDSTKNQIADLEAQIAAYQKLVGTQPGVVAGEKEIAAATGESTAQTQASTVITQAAIEAQDKLGESLASFVDPLGAYTGLLDEKKEADRQAAEATAADTESSKDSWKDYVHDVTVSFEEYITRLEEQVTAQTNWQTNMLQLAGRVSAGTLAELAKMGPEGAPLVADLVTRSDAELAHFSDLTAQRSQEATSAWGAQLTAAAPVLAAIGKTAGQGVVDSLAAQLQAGTTTVAQIAAQYGLNLAGGINPVLKSLGHTEIAFKNGSWQGFNMWEGGYTGDGGKYEPKGVVHGGEYVLTKEQTSRLGIDAIEAFANQGYANGGFVTAGDVPRPSSTAPYGMPISTGADATMQKGFDEVTAWLQANVGTAGSGAVGGAWGSLWQLVHSQIPQARMNSTFRAGDPGYHGKGKAIDFGFGAGPGGAGSAGLASINRLLHDSVGRNLAELIYDGIGDDRPDLKNGAPHTYNAGTRAEHRNHVHAAVYDQGGWLQPGYTMAYNGTGAPERVLTSREFSSGGRGGGGSGGPVNVAAPVVKVFLDGQEWRGIARVEVDNAMDQLASDTHYGRG